MAGDAFPHSPYLGCTDSTSESLVVDGTLILLRDSLSASARAFPSLWRPLILTPQAPRHYPPGPTQAPGVEGPRGIRGRPGAKRGRARRPKKVQVKIDLNDSQAWVLAPSPPPPPTTDPVFFACLQLERGEDLIRAGSLFSSHQAHRRDPLAAKNSGQLSSYFPSTDPQVSSLWSLLSPPPLPSALWDHFYLPFPTFK